MEDVDYFKEKKRMTKGCDIGCEKCQLGYRRNGRNLTCHVFEREYPTEAVLIVEKWSGEHPMKSYKDDFFEKFPDAEADEYGIPTLCRKRMYGGGYCPIKFTANCVTCWNESKEYCDDENNYYCTSGDRGHH